MPGRTNNHILNFDLIGELHTLCFISTNIDKNITLELSSTISTNSTNSTNFPQQTLQLSSTNKFTYGDDTLISDTDLTCAVLVGNRMLLFGGLAGFDKQVSVIYPGGVHRIQTLPFHFKRGRCHFSNNTVYLCFAEEDKKLCHKT